MSTEKHTDLVPEWNDTFEAVQPQPTSPPSRPAGASTPRRFKGGRKLCRANDLRKRYEIRGPSPTATPGSRRGTKSNDSRGSAKMVGDSSRPRSITSTRGATASRRARARHRAGSSGPNQTGEDSPAQADRDGLGGGMGLGRGGGAGVLTLPPTSQDLARVRYDRELLAVLEEEQAAEGAREAVLATAKARAKAAQARAGRGGLGSERIPSATDGGGGGDKDDNQMSTTVGQDTNQSSTTTELAARGGQDQRVPEGSDSAAASVGFSEGGHIMEGASGLPEGRHITEGAGSLPDGGNTMEGSGSLPERGNIMEGARVAHEAPPPDKRNRTEEEVAVAVATAEEEEATRLERELARERRAASQRIMRVSGAYEDALRELAEQPYYAQGSTPNRPLSKGNSISRNL